MPSATAAATSCCASVTPSWADLTYTEPSSPWSQAFVTGPGRDQAGQRALLIDAHQAAVSSDVCRQHRCQSPLYVVAGQKKAPPRSPTQRSYQSMMRRSRPTLVSVQPADKARHDGRCHSLEHEKVGPFPGTAPRRRQATRPFSAIQSLWTGSACATFKP